jgi:hypothetical protein
VIPIRAQWVTFVVLLAGTVAMAIALGRHGRILAEKGGHRIWELELAPTRQKADTVIAAWRKAGLVEVALEDIRFDYGFIALYATTLALAGFIGANVLLPALARMGPRLGWSMWVAGALDIVENLGMTVELRGSSAVAPLVVAASTIKWILVLVGFVYAVLVLVGIAVSLVRQNGVHRQRDGR